MKKLIAGILIGFILALSVGIFAAEKEIGQSFFNNEIKVKVNGETLDSELVTVILKGEIYGRNYVSVRDLAEALGAKVEWDGDTKTIFVTSQKEEQPSATPEPVSTEEYSYSNPAPLNTKQTITVEELLSTYKAEMSIKEIIRGDKAWNMIHAANQFNEPAPEGYEYLLAKIYFKLLDIDEGKAFDLVSSAHITLISESGKEYAVNFTVPPEPCVDAKLYKGADTEGWAVYLVKKDDLKPKITFGRKYDGSGGIWFKAYEE